MATVVRPEITTLTLENGETLIVKKRLNTGERREMLRGMRGPDGRMDGLIAGLATVLAYLVNWTVRDEQSGEPLVIKDQSRDVVIATLNSIDPLDYREVQDLIEAYDDRVDQERREEKKRRSGKTTSAPDSPSVPDSAFAMATSTR